MVFAKVFTLSFRSFLTLRVFYGRHHNVPNIITQKESQIKKLALFFVSRETSQKVYKKGYEIFYERIRQALHLENFLHTDFLNMQAQFFVEVKRFLIVGPYI